MFTAGKVDDNGHTTCATRVYVHRLEIKYPSLLLYITIMTSTTFTKPDPSAWKSSLPTLHTVFPVKRELHMTPLTSGSRLSLNRLSLTSLGLKAPSPPSKALLEPLLALKPDSPLGDVAAAVDGFKTYITKSIASKQSGEDAATFLTGYITTAIACSHLINSKLDDTSYAMAVEGVVLSLRAVKILYHAQLSSLETDSLSAIARVQTTFLATPFGDSHSLASLLQHSSDLAEELVTSTRERRRQSTSVDNGVITRADQVLLALRALVDVLSSVDSLPLPDVKAKAADKKRWTTIRPRQVEIQTRLVICEVALALALVDVEVVKVEEAGELVGNAGVESKQKTSSQQVNRGKVCEEEVFQLLQVVSVFRIPELLVKPDREFWLKDSEAQEPITTEEPSLEQGEEVGEEEEQDGEEDEEAEDLEDDDDDDELSSHHGTALQRVGDIVERFAEFRNTVYDSVLKDVPGAPGRRAYSLGKARETWDKLGRSLVATLPKVAEEMFPGEVDRWVELEEKKNAAKSNKRGGSDVLEGGGKRPRVSRGRTMSVSQV